MKKRASRAKTAHVHTRADVLSYWSRLTMLALSSGLIEFNGQLVCVNLTASNVRNLCNATDLMDRPLYGVA